MNDCMMQTTGAVPLSEGWAYWKDTVLPNVDCRRLDDDVPFVARRSLMTLASGLVVDTTSSALEVHRTGRHIAKDDRDDATVSMFVGGHGSSSSKHVEGSALATGDIALADIGQPYLAAGMTPYRELRLYVPRPIFSAKVGSIERIGGLGIAADAPLAALFARYFQGVVEALPTLSKRDADAGLDGVLHLLSNLVGSHTDLRHDEGEGASGDALLRLAESHIAATLADPGLDVARLARAVGTSRSRLYQVFEGRGGVAAAIRDARLDRARTRLAAPADRQRSLEQIAYLCGFGDYPAFSRAFRRRFDMAPRDCRGR